MKATIEKTVKGIQKTRKLAPKRAATLRAVKIKSILAPLDFSAESEKALAYAVAFARQFGARLTLLYVLEPMATGDFVPSFPLVMENDEMVGQCKKRLERLIQKNSLEPPVVEHLVRQGRAFREITAAARSLKSDLIIISTHGHSGVKRAILGSTTEKVVRHATCPVLVVRENERDFVETNPS